MCNKGFIKLIGIGKRRFTNLSQAVDQGLEFAPLDRRFMPREPGKQSVKREAVHDFLYELWEQAAETLPDQGHTSSNKRPRQGKFKYDSPNMSRCEIRHLPPGKFMDYLRLCRAEHPDYVISKKLFSSAGASTHFQRISFNGCGFQPTLPSHPIPLRFGWLTSATAFVCEQLVTMPNARSASGTG